ncbi:MAG: ATP phosphoribosyltransferase [Anaerolineales bacterium]
MPKNRNDIRLALPSKGRLAQGALEFLAEAGLRVYKPNPRQFEATIPAMPGLTVLFQRVSDIVVGVRAGSIDFGISGWDVFSEGSIENGEMLTLHRELGFGHCTLNVIVPERWADVQRIADLAIRRANLGRPLRVGTKFPKLTARFFALHELEDTTLIEAEGTLEVAPAIGYADLIVDLVSTGTTLRDNRLRILEDGQLLTSQACLIANRSSLKTRPEVLDMARQLLEFIVAHLRATENVAIYVNMRGRTPEAIAKRMLERPLLGGLQGPTISPVITRQQGDWFAAHIIARRDQLVQAIAELRAAGGSGVVVTPVTYIFEEVPAASQAMLDALED